MDIALCIEKLIPAARYGGSVTDNSKKSYDALRWEDGRKKPTWQEIEKVWTEVQKDLAEAKTPETVEQIVERKIKEMVNETALKPKGVI